MQPPHPCEPLEKLVDRLNEQLDALGSYNQEHGVFQGLIDVRSLTDMTRAMLKDTERKLANCRRHPAPSPNRPFLVTFPDPNCPRRIMESRQAQVRTMVYKWAAACTGLGVLVLSLGYALHEDRVARNLAAQNEQELASFNAARSQVDRLTATVNALASRPELPTAPAVDATIVHQTASNRQLTEGSGLKHLRLPVQSQRKVIEQRHSDLPVPHSDLKNAHMELTASSARPQDEVSILQSKAEHHYYEFDIDKSKEFQKEGALGIRLKKVNTKHQYADLELMLDDRNLSQKHVSLNQPILFYRLDGSQSVEVVISNISKDHIHGYVRAPEYRQSELASRTRNTPNPTLQPAPVASDRQHSGAFWRGFSVNKVLSRVKLRRDS